MNPSQLAPSFGLRVNPYRSKNLEYELDVVVNNQTALSAQGKLGLHQKRGVCAAFRIEESRIRECLRDMLGERRLPHLPGAEQHHDRMLPQQSQYGSGVPASLDETHRS